MRCSMQCVVWALICARISPVVSPHGPRARMASIAPRLLRCAPAPMGYMRLQEAALCRHDALSMTGRAEASSCGGLHLDGHAVPRVVRETAEVPYPLDRLRLNIVRHVSGLANDLRSLRRGKRQLCLPEGPRPRAIRRLIGAFCEFRRVPRAAAIRRDVHAHNPPPAARPREPAHGDSLVRVERGSRQRREHDRRDGHLLHRRVLLDVHPVQRAHAGVEHFVRHPPLPHPLRLLLRRRHLAQPLDVAHAHVPRHDHPQREAVVGGHRLAIHLIRQQHVARGREGLLARDGGLRAVLALEVDVAQPRGDLRVVEVEPALAQHVREPHAAPQRVRHRARAPCVARGLRHAVELGATVAAALQRRRDLHARHRAELGEREGARREPDARDLEREALLVEAWHRVVVADEPQRVGREPRVSEE
mmetsp:Transcript_29154/g.72682  ORF Transcript_29154/g.72682 Transcript_29154/m.72682 type:complete len:419 (+) Transcript_29154:218-1474(+)